MKYLNNPLWAKMPTHENLNQYPTILDILEEIAEQEEHECVTIDPIQRNFVTKMLRRGYFIVTNEKGSKEINLLPTGKRIDVLYRGQSKYYDNCFPSIYRNWTEEKQLLTNLQISEFKLLLDSHPILHYITNNPLYHPMINEPIWLNINYEGLSQHYGISTSLLDFSNDKWVSAFFAVTNYDEKTDKYNVMRPGENLEECFGVFYIYKNDYNQIGRQNAYPIGLHYFNRPGVQSGFALPMKKGQNLNTLPHCSKVFFRHDTEANERIYMMSQHSRTLFPDDELADYVQILKGDDNRCFSIMAIESCFKNYYSQMQKKDYDQLLVQYKIVFADQPLVSFPIDKLEEEMNRWENGDKDRYVNSLIVKPLLRLDLH